MLKQNLLLMIRKHCILFTVLILTQILSTVLVLFSFGVYQNTLYEKQAMTDKTKTICFRFDGKDAIEAIKKIKDAFPEESLKLNDSLKSISILSILDKEQMSSILEENGVSDTSSILQKSGGRMLLFSQPYFSNGKYDTEEWKNNLYREADLVENWFTGSHYDVGANVCVAPSYLSAMNDGIVSVGGVKYRNLYADNGEDTINFCPEDYPEISAKRFQLTLFYSKQLLKTEYERDLAVIQKLFGMDGIKVDDYVTINVENKATWKSMMLISVLMGLAATLIICLIYFFLHKERQKNLAIYELCGCTKPHAALVFIAESFIYLAASVALGLLIYKTIVIKKASVYYLWIKEISSTENIVKLMGGFVPVVIIAIVVTVLLSIRKTPREVLKAKE